MLKFQYAYNDELGLDESEDEQDAVELSGHFPDGPVTPQATTGTCSIYVYMYMYMYIVYTSVHPFTL